ncbi:MAG: transposase [Paracoccaceae bacterium]|nr:transposase [Paracoccaceae bacterium]
MFYAETRPLQRLSRAIQKRRLGVSRQYILSNYVYMLVSVPPKLAASDLMHKMKGRSSHKM